MRTATVRRLLAVAAAACLGGSVASVASGVSAASGLPAATGTATLFVIQGVDGASMDIAVDGRVVAADAAAKTIAGPLTVAPGRHVVQATAAGGPVQAAVTLTAGSSTDVVVHRPVEANQPPIITVYPNDLSPVSTGSGRVTVAHTAAVGPADIRVNGKVLFENIANGEQLTLVVPAKTYSVDIVPTAATSPVVLGPVDLPVAKASLTRVFAIGVAATGSMDAVVHVLPTGTRGSGADPSAVDAGDGGQAQALIQAHERATGDGPGAGSVLGPVIVGALAAGLLVVALRRWTSSARRSVG